MNTTKVGLNIREIREGKETLRWGSVAEESYQVYGTQPTQVEVRYKSKILPVSQQALQQKLEECNRQKRQVKQRLGVETLRAQALEIGDRLHSKLKPTDVWFNSSSNHPKTWFVHSTINEKARSTSYSRGLPPARISKTKNQARLTPAVFELQNKIDGYNTTNVFNRSESRSQYNSIFDQTQREERTTRTIGLRTGTTSNVRLDMGHQQSKFNLIGRSSANNTADNFYLPTTTDSKQFSKKKSTKKSASLNILPVVTRTSHHASKLFCAASNLFCTSNADTHDDGRFKTGSIDGVLTNLDEHIQKQVGRQKQHSNKLNKEIFNANFKSYEGQLGKRSVRARYEEKLSHYQKQSQKNDKEIPVNLKASTIRVANHSSLKTITDNNTKQFRHQSVDKDKQSGSPNQFDRVFLEKREQNPDLSRLEDDDILDFKQFTDMAGEKRQKERKTVNETMRSLNFDRRAISMMRNEPENGNNQGLGDWKALDPRLEPNENENDVGIPIKGQKLNSIQMQKSDAKASSQFSRQAKLAIIQSFNTKQTKEEKVLSQAENDGGEWKAQKYAQLSYAFEKKKEEYAKGNGTAEELEMLQKEIFKLQTTRCQEYLLTDSKKMMRKFHIKPSKTEFSRLNDQLFAILKTKLHKSKQPPSSPICSLQRFNVAKVDRDRKRMRVAIRKQKLLMKRVMKLRNRNNLKQLMYEMVYPTREKKKLKNDPDFKDSDVANLSEESDFARNQFYEEIDAQMAIVQANIKKKELNVDNDEDLRLISLQHAREMMEKVFDEKIALLKQQREQTKGNLVELNEYINKIKDQLGLQVFALLEAQKYYNTNKIQKKQQIDLHQEQIMLGLVDQHKRKTMNFSNWKEFKRCKLDMDECSSETSFNSLIDSDYELNNAVEATAMGISKRDKFDVVYKEGKRRGAELDLKTDKDYIYQRVVDENHDMPLPISAKVLHGKLVLADYTLSLGQSRALAQSFSQQKVNFLHQLMLENNGMHDQDFAAILRGLQPQEYFRSLSYKQNDFGLESLEALKPILSKLPSQNLHELRLVQTRSSPTTIENLCNFIATGATQLRSLKLVQMHLSPHSVKQVAEVVKNSVWLEQLDLSKNSLLPKAFPSLFEVIDKNRSLKYLDLSYNLIVPVDEHAAKGEVALLILQKNSLFKPIREWVLAKSMEIRVSKKQAIDNKTENYTDLVGRCLSSFIKYNKSIQYIDLDMTGLSHKILCDLVPSMQKAKSLLSLHIGFNPCIDQCIKKILHRRLRIQKTVKTRLYLPFDKTQASGPADLFYREGIEMGGIAKEKHAHKIQEDHNTEINEFKNCTFTRILGHREEMPGAGRWKVIKRQKGDQCWVNQLHSYGILMWSPKIGLHHRENGIQPGKAQMENAVTQIRANHANDPKQKCTLNQGVPVVFCEHNNYQGSVMTPLLTYLLKKKQKRPNFDKVAVKEITNDDYFQYELNLRTKDTKGNIIEHSPKVRKQIVAAKMERILAKLNLDYDNKILGSWQSIIRNTGRYEKPCIFNETLVDASELNNTWVLPMILKPGSHNFYIFLGEQDPDFIRHIAPVRKEQIPEYAKDLKQKNAPEFELKFSVFNDWKMDNEDIISRAMAHDVKYWKMMHIPGCDELQIQRMTKFVTRNWAELNEIFIMHCSLGHYPTMSLLDFRAMSIQFDIIDQNVSQMKLGILFQAANVELEDQAANDDVSLCRFEFFELCARIAEQKYLKPGNEADLASAFELFMNEHILVQYERLPQMQWNRWRVENLQQWSTSNLMGANQEILKKYYAKKCGKHSILSRKKCMKIFTSNADIELPWKQAQQAFGLSKMTVADENGDGLEEYEQIRFIEFLEMITRVAQLKYEGSEMEKQITFDKKIYLTLQALLRPEHMCPMQADEDDDSDSEIDDDY